MSDCKTAARKQGRGSNGKMTLLPVYCLLHERRQGASEKRSGSKKENLVGCQRVKPKGKEEGLLRAKMSRWSSCHYEFS